MYSALTSNENAWEHTLLVITYDEHGGLYDHCRPPGAIGARGPALLGPRVPALVVSPLVEPGRPCHAQLEHTAIIKTALRLFADEEAGESLGPRVLFANDVLDVLDATVRPTPAMGDVGSASITSDDLKPAELPPGASTVARAIEVAEKFKGRLDDLRLELIDFFSFLREPEVDGEEKPTIVERAP